MLLVKKFSLILRLECGFIFTAFSFLSLGTTPKIQVDPLVPTNTS